LGDGAIYCAAATDFQKSGRMPEGIALPVQVNYFPLAVEYPGLIAVHMYGKYVKYGRVFLKMASECRRQLLPVILLLSFWCCPDNFQCGFK